MQSGNPRGFCRRQKRGSAERNDKPMRRGNHNRVAEQRGVSVNPAPPRGWVKLPVWKKLLFTVITIAALFLAVEMVLVVVGVRPVLYDEDPYVGFSSYIPLFVEETGPDGKTAMVTAKNKLEFFNHQRFARNKPTGTYRIFCMGGSTTFGRPYGDRTSFCGWLRAMLPRADPSRQWELINAGGVSYASYRVAALMEGLVRYEPDLFIIYSGHNEFLERRTYSRIINTPGAVRGLGAIMSRTRIYAVVKQAVDMLGRQSGGTTGKRAHLPGEVETILENSLGPEGYHRDGELWKQVLNHYRYNLTRMVDIAQSVGAEVILVTPASNLRHCWPFKSEHRAGLSDADRKYWQTLFNHASEAYAAGQWDEALTAIDKAARVDDRYAHLHYLRGYVLWELKRYDEAKTAFIWALDEDVCPLRALTEMLDIILEVAEERNVPVVDFATLLERQSEHATPGENLFLDHVHPTIEGNRQLALALLEAMNKHGIVHLASTWGDAELKRVTQDVEDRLDPKAHGIALRNLSRLFRWAGKYEEGYKLGLRAAQMVPTDSEAHFQIGANALEVGRIDEAISHFRQALQIEPDYAHAHCGLGVALQSQGKLDEAISHYRQALQIKPDYTEAYSNLGNLLAGQGRLDEAINHYYQALQTNPNYAHAHCNLGIAMSAKGKLDEAVSHFRQALRFKLDYTEAHSNLGNALATQGRLEEATEHYRQALQIEPDYVHAHYNLGSLLQSQGKLDEAVSHYRQALQVEPDYVYAHCGLGVVLQSQGKLDEAISHFRQALQVEPDWPRPLNEMARILATHPDPKVQDASEAVRFAERAAELTKYQNASILDTLAAAYAAAGQFDRAVTTTQVAITLASAAQADELVNQLRKQLELYRQAKF